MSRGKLAILLGVLFATGFLGARVASRPAPKAVDAPSVERETPASKTRRQNDRRGGARVGFAAELERISKIEAPFLHGHFELLLHGDHAQEAAGNGLVPIPRGSFSGFRNMATATSGPDSTER